MTTALIILAVVIVLMNAFLIFAFWQARKDKPVDNSAAVTSSMQLLLQQLNDMGRNVDQKLGLSAKEMQESLKYQAGESYRVIKDITERLTKLDETNKQVVGFADQLKSLQDILKNPKQRGVLGEYFLETVLKNVLPPESYAMQYNLGKDENTGSDLIVDEVVFVKGKIIPVDSKFSLENYNRFIKEQDQTRREELEKMFINDLKERIKETSKYIQPARNTLEFAFMFIPHEAIYYDLLVNKIGTRGLDEGENMIEIAARKYKVIIVSPTSFLAYLQTVLQGLKALQIEEKTKDIIKRVAELGAHVGSYEKFLSALGKSLGVTVGHYTKAHHELKKIDKDITRITGNSIGIEPVMVEKPENE
jgi:DNA recombination protein RmuC